MLLTFWLGRAIMLASVRTAEGDGRRGCATAFKLVGTN